MENVSNYENGITKKTTTEITQNNSNNFYNYRNDFGALDITAQYNYIFSVSKTRKITK